MNDIDARIDYSGNYEAEDVLRWAIEEFGSSIKIACSFQNLVIVHMALQIDPNVTIFAIDTGRLHEETYQCAEDLQQQLGVKIQWFFPKHDPVEKLDYSRATPYIGPPDQTNKYTITAPILQTDVLYQCTYFGQNDLGVEVPGAGIRVTAGSDWTNANSNAQTEILFSVANLNTGFTGSPTLVIRDTVDLYRDIDMRNNNIVDIGPQNYNLETSLLDLTSKTQNITATAGQTQ